MRATANSMMLRGEFPIASSFLLLGVGSLLPFFTTNFSMSPAELELSNKSLMALDRRSDFTNADRNGHSSLF
jgi:hypothetical protein